MHNWSHNTRSFAHAQAELRAHHELMLRALYSHGHVDQMPRNEPLDFAGIDHVQREYFASGSAFEGLVTYGVNLRGLSQSDEATYHQDMDEARKRGMRIAIHAGQDAPQPRNRCGLRDARLARSQAPDLSLHPGERRRRGGDGANQHTSQLCDFDSEFRLGRAGDPRDALLRMRRHKVLISLSFDASSIAPPNMFECPCRKLNPVGMA